MDGLDEISLSGPTKISLLKGETVVTTQIQPCDVGLSTCGLDEIKGGSPSENAQHLMDVLDGKCGPRRDVALINSAAALVVAEAAEDLGAGLRIAAEAVDSGKARQKLDEFLQFRAAQ